MVPCAAQGRSLKNIFPKQGLGLNCLQQHRTEPDSVGFSTGSGDERAVEIAFLCLTFSSVKGGRQGVDLQGCCEDDVG